MIESTLAIGTNAALLGAAVATPLLDPARAAVRPQPTSDGLRVSATATRRPDPELRDVDGRARSGADPAAGAPARSSERIERLVEEARKADDTLRTRLDPETLRLFTEVIDPVTREARYRVPPTAISEAAERASEFRAKYERMMRPPSSPAEALARLT